MDQHILNMPISGGRRIAVYPNNEARTYHPATGEWGEKFGVSDAIIAALWERASKLPGEPLFKGCTDCGTPTCSCPP